MQKTDLTVSELVRMIESGELRLPEMQRRYVWQAPRVRDLLDSLYRNYPTGSILVWETDQKLPTRDLAVEQNDYAFSGYKLLLDGQQRLTSLSAVLRGKPIKVRGRKRDIDILFNLEHPDKLAEFTEVDTDNFNQNEDEDVADEQAELEENGESDLTVQERMKRMTFVVASKALAQQPHWVSVTEVFKSKDLRGIMSKAGITSFDDARYTKYHDRLNRLKAIAEYPYAMYVLPKGLDYEEVAEIFVRVNSLGAKLRGSDLALAQITAKWQNSLKLLEEFQDECEEKWMTLDLGLLVRAMVVFATEQSRFDSVATIPINTLKEGWEKAKDGLRYAINFLRTNADIEDESLLSSPLFFIVIAFYSYLKGENLSAEEEKSLLYWLHIANARGRYSRGSTETLLDADLNVLKKGGAPKELLDVVKQQFGRVHIEPNDFVGRGAGSPLFSIVYLALKAQGAKDWFTGIGLSLSNQGKAHNIQYHHIFPKSLLKGKYEKQEINEIANMAFISGRTNRKISNKEPYEYLPEIKASRGNEALIAQCVPIEEDYHKIDNYRKFLDWRRIALAKAVNTFIDNSLQ